MKSILSLALLGTLAVTPALAAGSSYSSSSSSGGPGTHPPGTTSAQQLNREEMQQLGISPQDMREQQYSANQSSGSSAGDLRQVQHQLQQQGYYGGQVDGQMGPKTQAALRDYQRDQGMRPTGQLDQQTASALMQGSGTQQSQMPSDVSRTPSGTSATQGRSNLNSQPQQGGSGGTTRGGGFGSGNQESFGSGQNQDGNYPGQNKQNE